MSTVIVYSKPSCPYCVAAKELLNHKGVAFEEIRVDLDPVKMQEMLDTTGGRTMPQIVINGEPVGGYDDLRALEDAGELDKKLAK